MAGATWSAGTLTVTSGGSTVASIKLAGNYTNATFTIVDYNGELAISDPPATVAATGNSPSPSTNGNGSVALLGNYMASLFASAEGQVNTQTPETSQNQTVITQPHQAA